MFTGIIEGVGRIVSIDPENQNAKMRVQKNKGLGLLDPGESIAVNGVCLTVTEDRKDYFDIDLSSETLDKTSFSKQKPGMYVNLERALTPAKRMGGHFVTGHVDRVGKVVAMESRDDHKLFVFEHPQELSIFIIEKGSVAIDGISLTVFDCKNNRFSVAVIPYTLEHTNLSFRKIGDAVNVECDMIGKFVVKACQPWVSPENEEKGITQQFLKENGWL